MRPPATTPFAARTGNPHATSRTDDEPRAPAGEGPTAPPRREDERGRT
jgi:hypothetical protein